MYRAMPALTNGEVVTPAVPSWNVDRFHQPLPATPPLNAPFLTNDSSMFRDELNSAFNFFNSPGFLRPNVGTFHPQSPTTAVPTQKIPSITYACSSISEELNSEFSFFNSPDFFRPNGGMFNPPAPALPTQKVTSITNGCSSRSEELDSAYGYSNSPAFCRPNGGMFNPPAPATPTQKIASVTNGCVSRNEELDSAYGYSNSPAFCRPNSEQHHTERMPPFPSNQKTEINDDINDETELSNALGQLKHLYGTQPTFETSCEGPPHNRLYICRVTLHGRTTEGNARSNKLARRIAAAKMLKLMTPAKVPDHTCSKSGAYKISCERTIVHEKITVTVDTREELMECE